MPSLLKDKRFWLASAERAVLTSAQTLAAELAVFSAVEIREKGLEGLPWYAMISVAVVAGVLSFLSSIGKGGSGSAGYKVELSKDPGQEDPANSPQEDPVLEAPESLDLDSEDKPESPPLPEEVPAPEEAPTPEETPAPEEGGRKKHSAKQGKGGSKKSK